MQGTTSQLQGIKIVLQVLVVGASGFLCGVAVLVVREVVQTGKLEGEAGGLVHTMAGLQAGAAAGLVILLAMLLAQQPRPEKPGQEGEKRSCCCCHGGESVSLHQGKFCYSSFIQLIFSDEEAVDL